MSDEDLICGSKASPTGVMVMEHVFSGNGTCQCGGAGLMRFDADGAISSYEDMRSAPPLHRISKLHEFVGELIHVESEARNVAVTAQEVWEQAQTRLAAARRLQHRLMDEILGDARL